MPAPTVRAERPRPRGRSQPRLGGRAPAAALVALAAACSLGCGAGAAAPDPAARSTAAAPVTHRDPMPYTPAPTGRGRAGETVALVASGGEDQARRMLLATLEALRDADEQELNQLLADEVEVLRDRRSRRRTRGRSELIERLLIYARRAIIPADAAVGDLVDLEAVEVARAAQRWQSQELPSGVRPTDLVVEVPIRDAGQGPLRTMLHWHVRGRMVVRPGRDPRVLAL